MCPILYTALYYYKLYYYCNYLSIGVPRMIRMDKGTENGLIGHIQVVLRQHDQDSVRGEKSVVLGPSTANQVHGPLVKFMFTRMGAIVLLHICHASILFTHGLLMKLSNYYTFIITIILFYLTLAILYFSELNDSGGNYAITSSSFGWTFSKLWKKVRYSSELTMFICMCSCLFQLLTIKKIGLLTLGQTKLIIIFLLSFHVQKVIRWCGYFLVGSKIAYLYHKLMNTFCNMYIYSYINNFINCGFRLISLTN